MSTKTVDFRETVDESQGVEAKKPCPVTGHVSKVAIHWPSGCNGLVQVAVLFFLGGPGGLQKGIVPTDSGVFLALNDATPIFDVYFPVKIGDYFGVTIRNTDAVNPHTISVDIIITPTITEPVKAEEPETLRLPDLPAESPESQKLPRLLRMPTPGA